MLLLFMVIPLGTLTDILTSFSPFDAEARSTEAVISPAFSFAIAVLEPLTSISSICDVIELIASPLSVRTSV